MKRSFTICLSVLMLFCFLGLVACENEQELKEKLMDIYIIAGQSNALGVSPVKDLSADEKKEFENILIYQSSNKYYVQNNKVLNVKPGYGFTTEGFGLEIGMALAIKDNYTIDNKAMIFKYASDGTSLYDKWNPTTEPKGADYLNLIDTIIKGKEEVKKLGFKANIKGMVWMQGENDSIRQNQAAAYAKNLENFIISLRLDILEPNLQFVIGGINPNNQALPNRAIIIEAQKSIANVIPNTVFVDTSDLTDLIDIFHYTAKCEIELGKRLTNAIKIN